MGMAHVYSSNPLDRGDHERRDDQWLADMLANPSSKFLPLRDSNVPVLDLPASDGGQGGLGWLTTEEVGRLGVDATPLFLGLLDGVGYFTIDVSQATADLESNGRRFVDARSATDLLTDVETGMVAQARSQVIWHSRHGFCSICGHPTFIKRGGQVRQCSHCETEHYPRTDPVVISLVLDGDRCLMGRSAGRRQPTNRYSALAGFLDQGESMEEAVAREVMEEAGIKVRNVRYHSSQPWPFPYSLMIGSHAEAATTDISIDYGEMADVRWFDRDAVERALRKESEVLTIPEPLAIAHHLIRAWVQGEVG